MNFEIDSKDIVSLMLQYMKENNLLESMAVLQRESKVTMNTVDNIEAFVSDILHGRWDAVLTQVSQLTLPRAKMSNLYQQIILELLENGERDLAQEMLRNTEPMKFIKENHPDRHLKLEHLSKRPYFNSTDAYELGSSKDKQRHQLAEELSVEVSVVAPSRLLAIINQALRFQQTQGTLPTGAGYDLFKGSRKTVRRDTEELVPSKPAGLIRFASESHAETAMFSPDGLSLVTGSVDGFIEVWDHETCHLRKDLEYQSKDELMMHEEAVLCCGFSKEGDHLATGSQAGRVKVWKISTGVCVRKFNQAHGQGITSIVFARDNTQLLTASFDNTARIHGLKSGKTLKEFRGHTSYVNGAIYSKEGANVVTVSSDGTAKLWDLRTTECLLTFRPGVMSGSIVRETTLLSVQLLPSNPEHLVIVSKSCHAYVTTLQGQLVNTFSSGKLAGGDFLCSTVSPLGKWLYCMGEDGVLYVFDVAGGQLETVVQVADKEVIGIFHHPHRNLLGTITDDGELKLWKP